MKMKECFLCADAEGRREENVNKSAPQRPPSKPTVPPAHGYAEPTPTVFPKAAEPPVYETPRVDTDAGEQGGTCNILAVPPLDKSTSSVDSRAQDRKALEALDEPTRQASAWDLPARHPSSPHHWLESPSGIYAQSSLPAYGFEDEEDEDDDGFPKPSDQLPQENTEEYAARLDDAETEVISMLRAERKKARDDKDLRSRCDEAINSLEARRFAHAHTNDVRAVDSGYGYSQSLSSRGATRSESLFAAAPSAGKRTFDPEDEDAEEPSDDIGPGTVNNRYERYQMHESAAKMREEMREQAYRDMEAKPPKNRQALSEYEKQMGKEIMDYQNLMMERTEKMGAHVIGGYGADAGEKTHTLDPAEAVKQMVAKYNELLLRQEPDANGLVDGREIDQNDKERLRQYISDLKEEDEDWGWSVDVCGKCFRQFPLQNTPRDSPPQECPHCHSRSVIRGSQLGMVKTATTATHHAHHHSHH